MEMWVYFALIISLEIKQKQNTLWLYLTNAMVSLIIKFTSTLIIRRVKKNVFFSWNSACVGLAWEESHLPLIRAEGLKKSQWSPAFLSSHMIYHNQTDAQ